MKTMKPYGLLRSKSHTDRSQVSGPKGPGEAGKARSPFLRRTNELCTYRGSVPLLWWEGGLYLGYAGSLWRWSEDGGERDPLVRVPSSAARRLPSRFRILVRLWRLGMRELIGIEPGRLLGIVDRKLVLLESAGMRLKTVLRVRDGGRPRGLEVTPDGALYAGEYGPNSRRHQLRIWASEERGEAWYVAKLLPAGTAKHIHNIVWDDHRQGLWVLTGDKDSECSLLFTSDHFHTLEEVARGGQQFRACNLFCRPEGIYYGTDSELAPNWFVFFDTQELRLHKIHSLPGSCLYANQMAGHYFVSTCVEPSRVNNCRYATLWYSSDLHNWKKLVEFEKDLWPGEYFGFGNIVLPRVQGDCPYVIFSPLAVKNYDMTTFMCSPQDLGL